jgi:hypothetical protein
MRENSHEMMLLKKELSIANSEHRSALTLDNEVCIIFNIPYIWNSREISMCFEYKA